MEHKTSSGIFGSLRNLVSSLSNRGISEKRSTNRRAAEGILTLLTGAGSRRPETAEAELLDISQSGVAFSCDVECWMGQQLCLTDGATLVELEIISRIQLGKRTYRYGCRFIQWGELPKALTHSIPRSSFDLISEALEKSVDCSSHDASESPPTAVSSSCHSSAASVAKTS